MLTFYFRQQLLGGNVMLYYIVYIFEMAGEVGCKTSSAKHHGLANISIIGWELGLDECNHSICRKSYLAQWEKLPRKFEMGTDALFARSSSLPQEGSCR